MTNEESSPALIPGSLPTGLLPELGCNGQTTQQIYEQILGVTGVAIAAGQRGPQGLPGPAGPTPVISYRKTDYQLASGAQNQTVTVAAGRDIGDYFFTLINPTDGGGTPPSPNPAIASFSLIGSTSWRAMLTAATPAAGWILRQTLIVNET